MVAIFYVLHSNHMTQILPSTSAHNKVVIIELRSSTLLPPFYFDLIVDLL